MGTMYVGNAPKLKYTYDYGGKTTSVSYTLLNQNGIYNAEDGVTAYNLAVAINEATRNSFISAAISATAALEGE